MIRPALPLLLCAVTLGAADPVPPRVPLENDFVKVVDVTVQPGQKTRMHDHKINRVMVYLNAGSQHFEWQGGRPTDLKWKAGQALWSPAAGMHIAEVTSAQPVRIIEIELKKPGSGKNPAAPALDPVKAAPKKYHVEFENDQVRVVRGTAGPKETIPLHEHATNRVTVMLTDQDFRITTSDGTVQNPKRKAGEAVWGTPVKHTEENLSNKPFEIIMVELK
jgi:predicted metal-dependent enzyme (double-stranded beta helix superfamily)